MFRRQCKLDMRSFRLNFDLNLEVYDVALAGHFSEINAVKK